MESCAPLASSEAYQAIRMRASAALDTGRSRPEASYQRPPSTAKDWCSQAVARPREVSAMAREPPSDTTAASPACVRQPYGVAPGSSKSPLVSEAKKKGSAAEVVVGDAVGSSVGRRRRRRWRAGREFRRVHVERGAARRGLRDHPQASVRGIRRRHDGGNLDELPARRRLPDVLLARDADADVLAVDELEAHLHSTHRGVGAATAAEPYARRVLGARVDRHARGLRHQGEVARPAGGDFPRRVARLNGVVDDLEGPTRGRSPTVIAVLEAAVRQQVLLLGRGLRADGAGGEGDNCERADEQRERSGTPH